MDWAALASDEPHGNHYCRQITMPPPNHSIFLQDAQATATVKTAIMHMHNIVHNCGAHCSTEHNLPSVLYTVTDVVNCSY